MLYLAWKHGHADPYALFNGLDGEHRRVGEDDGLRYPPPHPWRLRMFIYGCASYAEKDEVERATIAAGGSVSRGM